MAPRCCLLPYVAKEKQPGSVIQLERFCAMIFAKGKPCFNLCFTITYPSSFGQKSAHFNFPHMQTRDNGKTEITVSMKNQSLLFHWLEKSFSGAVSLPPFHTGRPEPAALGLCPGVGCSVSLSDFPHIKALLHSATPPVSSMSHPSEREVGGRWVKENLSAQPRKHMCFWHEASILIFYEGQHSVMGARYSSSLTTNNTPPLLEWGRAREVLCDVPGTKGICKLTTGRFLWCFWCDFCWNTTREFWQQTTYCLTLIPYPLFKSFLLPPLQLYEAWPNFLHIEDAQ